MGQARDQFDYDKLMEKFDYGNLVIIDLMKADERYAARGIQEKWQKTHPGQPATLLDGEDFLNGKCTLPPKNPGDTSGYKIVFIAHGREGANSVLRPSTNKGLRYETLAKSLNEFIPQTESAVVNLISCSAGRGEAKNPHTAPKNSFAAKLHYELATLQKRDVPVVARKANIQIEKDKDIVGSKFTAPLHIKPAEAMPTLLLKIGLTFLSKQPGSKMIFTLNKKGKQIALDAYYNLWKRQVLRIIQKAAEDTKVLAKKQMLNQWLHDFAGKSNEAIAKALYQELRDENSPLFMHKNFISSIFLSTASHRAINNLLEEWSDIVRSKHTSKAAVETGIESIPRIEPTSHKSGPP